MAGQVHALSRTGLPQPDLAGRPGFEALRKHAPLAILAAVMLATSSSEQDVLRAYELNCNCHITKPVDPEQFIGVVGAIDEFWLTVVTLPPKEA